MSRHRKTSVIILDDLEEDDGRSVAEKKRILQRWVERIPCLKWHVRHFDDEQGKLQEEVIRDGYDQE